MVSFNLNYFNKNTKQMFLFLFHSINEKKKKYLNQQLKKKKIAVVKN